MAGSKRKTKKNGPTVAPGMNDFVEQDASPEQIKKGDFTRVTTLSYDETH